MMTEYATDLGESPRYKYTVVFFNSVPIVLAQEKETGKIFINYTNMEIALSKEGKSIKDFFTDEVLDQINDFKKVHNYSCLMDLPQQCKQDLKKLLQDITGNEDDKSFN